MAERFNPVALEQLLLSFKYHPDEDWNDLNIRSESRVIGFGSDSFVFPLGKSEVVKVYRKGLSFRSNLELYQEVINRASDLCLASDYFIRFHNKVHRVFVNPISSIHAFERSNILCAISRRVLGRSLYDVGGNQDGIDQLSVWLNKKLCVEGIGISDWNVRVNDGLFVRPALIVTDLSDYIGTLSRKR